MSAIPIVGKVFKEIDSNPILKTVAIAAVIYFTASAASSYFSAEAATVASAGGGMAATTSASATAASTASTAAGAASTAGAAGTGLTAGTVGTAGLNTTLPAALSATEIAAAETAASTLGSSATATNWFSKNPLATMILGQGISGAASTSEARRASDQKIELQKQMLAQKENARTDRGLMGFNYDGSPGLINSRISQPPPQDMTANVQGQNAPQVAPQATAAPIIASQQVAPQQVDQSPQQVPIQRSDLPKLNKPRV